VSAEFGAIQVFGSCRRYHVQLSPNDLNMTLPVLTAANVRDFLRREFPQIGGAYVVEDVGPMRARMRLVFHEMHLRPGGTISGPAMFGLADVSLYVAILANVGYVGLAVTTNLNINFLRKPEPADLLGEARLIKLGKRLAVGEVSIFASGTEELVAHAVGTYSIPPREDAVS
jgi:uncharacterized protein (TIGR00369 family)